MRIPDFFVVGAAKSGTTSMWQYLGQHPQIFMTKDIWYKELGYFCDYYGINDFNQYLSHFKGAGENQLIGESCHPYLSSPESAQKIKETAPNAKIIMILRNPVSRSYSLYNWMVSHGYEYFNTFEKALKEEESRVNKPDFKTNNPQKCYVNYYYYNSGLYYEQVKRYFDCFGRENCKVYIFEEFRKEPLKYMRDIFSFLGVDPGFNPDLKVFNESHNVWNIRLQYFFRIKLSEFLRKRFKFGSQKVNRITESLIKINTRQSKPKPMKLATRKMLKEKYESDICKLAKILNKDLSIWLK